MKTRLPKGLLTLIAMVAASTAQAGYISPTTIWTEAGEMQLGTNPDNVEGYTIDVKDGDSEATITKDVVSTSGLFVRDGKLTIGGTDTHNTVKINPLGGGQLNYINGTPEVLNVAGKDAVVVIDNATVTTDYMTGSAVGGPDGNGTLIIQNGGKYDGSNQYYFFVGYKSYRLEGETPDYSANGTPQQIIYATTNNVGDSRVDADGNPDFSNRYVGTYTEGIGGTEFGRGVVTVTANSEFDATGIREFCMGEGEVNILDNSSFNTSNLPVCIGYGIGATSLVNIESDSVWNVNGQLITGGYTNSRTVINVKDATVNLNYKKGAYVGTWLDKADNGSTSEFNVMEGSTVNVAQVFAIGLDATGKLAVDSTSAVKDLGYKNEKGEALACLYVGAMGTVENKGTIEVFTEVDGGVFTMMDGATAAGLTSTVGSINIQDSVTFTGDVSLSGQAILTFDLGSTMNLDGSVFSFEAGTIYVEIGDLVNVDAENDVLFTLGYTEFNALQISEGTKIQLLQNGVNYGAAVDFNVGTNVATKIIPEPASATLSLAALMMLCARRRRRA